MKISNKPAVSEEEMAYFKENEEKIVKMQAGIKGYNARKKMNA